MTPPTPKAREAKVSDVVERMKRAFIEAASEKGYTGSLNVDAGIRAALDALAENVSPEMISIARREFEQVIVFSRDEALAAAIRAAILAGKTEG